MENNEQLEIVSDFEEVSKPVKEEKKIRIPKGVIIGILAILVLGGLLYFLRGYLVAANVNGGFVSRWSVMNQLEKQYGKQVLEGLITKKLIESALKDIQVTDDEVSAALKKVEDQLTAQGTTLDAALEQNGMTKDELMDQLVLQKKLEKKFSDKVSVSDEEAKKFLVDNKATTPKGVSQDQLMSQARDVLRQQKLNAEIQGFVQSLKGDAKINYFGNYK
jgi:hypothetical protein